MKALLLIPAFLGIGFLSSPLVVACDEKKDATARVAEGIANLAKGKGDWKKLVVTYDDMHGFHGGLTLSIDGIGKVTQKSVGTRTGESRDVSEADLKALVELLVKHKAWEQREPDRLSIPDESRARLVLKYGDDEVKMWEWHNDLPKNKRLVEIRAAMKKAAWKEVPKE